MLCALHTSKVGGSGGRASNPWLIFCWLAVCSRLPCHALTPSLAGGARFLGASAGRLLVVKVLASLNPSADVMALASLEVDIGNLAEGNCMIVKWRGKPVFVRSRTEDEIEQATSVGMGELRDPESDEDRAQKPGTLVVIGVCTRTRGARALKTASRSPRSPLRFTLTPLFFFLPTAAHPLDSSAHCHRSLQTLDACRSTARVTLAAGSARATARTTTPLVASERALRPSTSRSHPTPLSTTRRSSSVRSSWQQRRRRPQISGV